MKISMKNLNEIRTALDKGLVVYWANTSYIVHYVDAFEHTTPYTVKNKKALRVSHTSYFGSLLQSSEVTACYIVLDEKGV